MIPRQAVVLPPSIVRRAVVLPPSRHPYSCLVNYYGGKSKVAHLYPPPAHGVIVEPFCGMAAYSLRYCDRQVVLNDLDARVVAIWAAILTLPLEEILRHIPDRVARGDRVSGFLTPETPYGVEQIMRACANVGAFGDKDHRDAITPFAAKGWHRVKDRLAYWHPRVRHWRVHEGPYWEVPNGVATWFVDPPYSGGAPGRKGADYLHSAIDYTHLAHWCRTRGGTVIVAEQAGAAWLPFRPLATMTTMKQGGTHQTREVVAVLEPTPPRTPVVLPP